MVILNINYNRIRKLAIFTNIITFLLVINMFSYINISAQQLNIIRINRNSIEWLFTPNKSVINPLFNEVQLAIIPSKGITLFNSIINLGGESTFRSNISFHIIGRERMYYRMMSTIFLDINNTIIKQSESIEGNMIISKNSIIIQWYKYQISLSSASLLSSKKNITTEIISKYLQSVARLLKLDYIDSLEGLLIVDYNQNSISLGIIMYDVKINSTKYLSSKFQESNISDELLNIPMRSDIDIIINQNRASLEIRYSCIGMDIEDPIKSQLLISSFLPLVMDIQKIIDRLNVTRSFGSAIFNKILINLVPRITTLFITPLIKDVYSKIYVGMVNENITDAKLIAIYKNVQSPVLYIALNNSNIYLMNESRIRFLIKEFYSYINQQFRIFHENLDTWIEKAVIENNITSIPSPTPSMQSNDMALKMLAIVIGIVSIQTFIVIYMIYKLYIYSKRSGRTSAATLASVI